MRDIKFRGKNITTNHFEYGLLKKFGSIYSISVEHTDYRGVSYYDDYDVDTDTIGQFIGRKDKNGKEIYEGDVITVNGKYPKLVKYDERDKSFGLANIEDLGKEKWMHIWQHPNSSWWTDFKREIEVVGNIYDNPELIEEE